MPRKLTDCDTALLAYLADLGSRFANPTPSLQQMCNALGYGLPLIRKSLARLEKEGYIVKTPAKNKRNAPIRKVTETFNRSTYIYSTKNFCEYAETDADKSVWHGPENTTDTKYWQFMELIERNTEAWCKAQRVAPANAQAAEQQVLHFPPDPDFHACFFWDNTQQEAA